MSVRTKDKQDERRRGKWKKKIKKEVKRKRGR